VRISTAWSQQLGVNAMQAQQAKMVKTQMQLSTGLNVLTPADDPVAAVRALDLQGNIDKTAQYQDNIATVRSRLNIEEASLSSAEEILFRAKELTIQALNAPINANDRLSIKYEIDQLLDNMVGLANTKNANGEYIFSGDLSNVPPFSWNGDANAYVYQGGINQRTLDIALERRVADGDLGSAVFQWVSTASQEGNATVNDEEINQRSIMDTLQTLSEALSGNYDIPQAAITGSRFVRYGIDYTSNSSNFTLTDDTPNSVTVSLNGKYASLDEVVSDINSQLAGNNMQAIADGNQLQFVSLTEGESSAIQINAAAVPSGSFLTDFGFSDGDKATGVDLGGVIASTTSLSVARDYAAEPAQFELVDESGISRVVSLNSTHADVNALIADIEGQLAGSSFAIVAGNNGVGYADPLTFQSISSGLSSSITIKQISGDFLTDVGFEEGQTGRIYDRTLNDVLLDMESGMESLLQARTSVGARLHALDDQENQNDKYSLDMKSTLSEIRDLDYAEAISRFNIENTALQAAQQAFSRVQNLSLFNFL
jgi:flagellar hook-associated protein 3 FlgL